MIAEFPPPCCGCRRECQRLDFDVTDLLCCLSERSPGSTQWSELLKVERVPFLEHNVWETHTNRAVTKNWQTGMGEFYVILLVLFGSVFLVINAQNPCVGVPDGTFVNDFTACDGFFTCVREMPVPGTCPIGFNFNEPEQKCDHPWNVICLICEEDTTGAGFVRVPIEDECRMYTLCINSRGFLQECGDGQMFDAVGRQCDLEANVACEDRKCPNNLNPNVPTFVPDRTDCSRYVICMNREPIAEEQCSGDLLFNPATSQCDFPENVECEEIPPPSKLECPPTGLHFIPIADTCTDFAICLDGQRVGESSCADGLIFDIITSDCQIPSDDTQCLAPPA